MAYISGGGGTKILHTFRKISLQRNDKKLTRPSKACAKKTKNSNNTREKQLKQTPMKEELVDYDLQCLTLPLPKPPPPPNTFKVNINFTSDCIFSTYSRMR